MAGQKAKIIARLKLGPATLLDLKQAAGCASIHSASMLVYRLREEGYGIDSKVNKRIHTYTLRYLPGDLRPVRLPRVGDRPVPQTD